MLSNWGQTPIMGTLTLIDQLTADVFVQQAGGQRLVWNAFFEGYRCDESRSAARLWGQLKQARQLLSIKLNVSHFVHLFEL